MKELFGILLISWPLLSTVLAVVFYKKQNSSKSWTGGPISWPKALWLSYTVTTWFFMPIWFLGTGQLPGVLIPFYLFHLFSWWLRGPLELIMIYKWLNWSPRYGISHDIFHILGCVSLLIAAFWGLEGPPLEPLGIAAFIFAEIIIVMTIGEVIFAYLFLKVRTQQEESENIYFASDDPKWIFINRVTSSFVIPAYLHLYSQSIYLVLS